MLRYSLTLSVSFFLTHAFIYLLLSVLAETIRLMSRVWDVQVVSVPGFKQFPEILMGLNHVCFIFLTLNMHVVLAWC